MKRYAQFVAAVFMTAFSSASIFASTLDSIETQPVPEKSTEKDALQAHALQLRALSNKIAVEKNASKKKHLEAEHKALIKAYNALKARPAPINNPAESDRGD